MTDVQESVGEATPAKAKKARVCKRVYIDAAGGESSHASADATALEFRFVGGPTQRYTVKEFPENIRACFGWNGLSQALGDKFAGLSGTAAAEAQATKAAVYMDGDWIKPGEGIGVPSTVTFEVYCLYLKGEGKTAPDTDEGRAKIAAYIKGLTKEDRKGLMADPQIAAIHAQYKVERAAKAAKEAKAAAKGATSTDKGAAQFD